MDQALAIGRLCPAPYGGVEVRRVRDTSGGDRPSRYEPPLQVG
ncbi:MAG: hypothetical protein H0U35_01025 [Sporichthyaceae bacterium]|nr:hypothetical protein [Sporichthyaceae bacterium]